MTRPSLSSAAPALALLFNAMVWGLSWIAFKALHGHGLHPLWSTVVVYAGALLALLLWRPASVRSLLGHPHLLALMAAAGLTNVGFNWAVTVGDVVRVTLLFYLMPVWSIGWPGGCWASGPRRRRWHAWGWRWPGWCWCCTGRAAPGRCPAARRISWRCWAASALR